MSRWERFRKEFMRDWQLHLLILIPLIYVLIFTYGPMYGIQVAFRNYTPAKGIIGSDWVGLRWFSKFLSSANFRNIFFNTVFLSLYSLATFPLSIILALILNSMENKRYSKTVQTISYLPHFISIAVLVGIVNMVFSPVNGIYGNLFRLFGGEGYPTDFRASAEAFRHLYVWSGVWQNIGWNSIIYIAALSGVPAELHEAAKMDGATRLRRIWHIDLPAIAPTICIMFILRCGSIISVGFEKAFLMQSNLNRSVSEVIATYVYTTGMKSFSNFSYGTAVELFNTLINLTMVLVVNKIVKKASDREISLF